MRILLVNDYATDTAGAERVTLNLRDELRARGHHVRVFASRAQLIPGDSFADASCYGTTSRLQTLTSAVNPSAARALKRELRDFDPDVVQVHMFLWQLSPSILALLGDRPSVYWPMTFKPVCPTGLKMFPSGAACDVRAGVTCLAHGCITHPGVVPLMVQRQRWRRGRSAFSAIVGISDAVRRQLEADGIATHDLIWPGAVPARQRPPLAGPPTATFAGRLVPEKGADVLIRAFRRVRDLRPDARLVVAGSGPAGPELRALVARLELDGAVEMPGQLHGEQLAAVLDRAWAHVVPSRWPEPFGLSATEAMMRGCAVVASDIGGLAESVEHEVTGLRVAAGDEAALASALDRLLSDRPLAEQFGAAGRARARDLFSIHACATRFEALYESLLHSTPSHVHVG